MDEITTIDRKIKVALVDGKQLYREGMKRIINSYPSLCCIVEGKTKTDAFQIIESNKLDVVLVDSYLIYKADLYKLKKTLQTTSRTKIILMADDIYTKKYFIEAIHSGINGFILQDINDNLFVKAIKTVHKNQYWIHPQMSNDLVLIYQTLNHKLKMAHKKGNSQRPLHSLTKREFEMLELLVWGYGNETIITKMKITDATVKTHIRNILEKLDVSNRSQAVLLAIQNGWVKFDLQNNATFKGKTERR